MGYSSRTRMAVNLRMAEPGQVAQIPIDHFDGLDTWDELPADGRCIKDLFRHRLGFGCLPYF